MGSSHSHGRSAGGKDAPDAAESGLRDSHIAKNWKKEVPTWMLAAAAIYLTEVLCGLQFL